MDGLEDIASERWGALGLSGCPQLETFEFSFPPFSGLSDRSGNACAKIVRLLPAGVRTIVLRLPESNSMAGGGFKQDYNLPKSDYIAKTELEMTLPLCHATP